MQPRIVAKESLSRTQAVTAVGADNRNGLGQHQTFAHRREGIYSVYYEKIYFNSPETVKQTRNVHHPSVPQSTRSYKLRWKSRFRLIPFSWIRQVQVILTIPRHAC